MSVKKLLEFRGGRGSLQPDGPANRYRSASMDSRNRGSYASGRNRPSSEERKQSGPNCSGFRWSGNRKSSINVYDAKRTVKDIRPLSDKTYQKAKIKELISFLEETEFSYPITEAKFMSPSKKDFEVVFKFLFSFLDPQYEIQKLDDEAPKILKFLHYPFMINKSAFTYVARNNWPSLLGILLWLLDVVKFMQKTDLENVFMSGDEENAKENAILLPFIINCYHNEVEDEEQVDSVFKKIVQSRFRDLSELQEIYEEKKSVVEKQEKELDEVEALNKLSESLDQDMLKYEEFFIKMNKHMQKRMIECQELSEKEKQKEKELEELKAQISEKLKIYDAQGFDGKKQLNYYDSQKKELLENLEKKRATFKEVQDLTWEMEIKCSQALHKWSSSCEKFNDLYSNTAEIAKNALNPFKDINETKAKKMCSIMNLKFPEFMLPCTQKDFLSQASVCKEILNQLKENLESSSRNLQSLSTTIKQSLSEVLIQKSELNLSLKMLASQETQQEKELTTKKEQELKEISKLQQQQEVQIKMLDELQSKRLELEKVCNEMKDELPEIMAFKSQKKKELEEYLIKQRNTIQKYAQSIENLTNLVKEKGEEAYGYLQKLANLSAQLQK